MEQEKQKKSVFPLFRKKTRTVFIVTFLLFVSLIVATYAWFSASLNVKIKFFDIKVSTDTGLFISLDGIHFSDAIEVSRDSVIFDLKKNYPNHTNQWASGGLWSVSTNGIPNSNTGKFAVYEGKIGKYTDKPRKGIKFLNTTLMPEDKSTDYNQYIAFDIFLKNVSGSPKKDNLYIGAGTYIDFDETADEETIEKMQDIMNSLRSGVSSFAGLKVEKLNDYSIGLDGLPKSNVLKFYLEGNNSLVVRPSGTEPKIKIYIGVKDNSLDSANSKLSSIKKEVVDLLEEKM